MRCRRCAVFVLLAALLAALPSCRSSGSGGSGGSGRSGRHPLPEPTELFDAGVAGGDQSLTLPIALTEPSPDRRDQASARYYEGYLAEVLHGDMGRARTAYELVMSEAGARDPEIAARAALRLAEIDALAGQRRQALELMARASILGRDNIEILEQADRLHARLGSLRLDSSEVRGPPLGTVLESVGRESAERFVRAEELLRAYHRTRLEPRLEELRAGVRVKESAMDAAVRAYRQVVAMDEPVAAVAAEFRIASLYHDLALALMFELPPELEPRAAAQVRRSLRASALGYLSRAQAAYLRSRAAGSEGGNAASERWLVAAGLGLRSVDDLLGGRE